MSLIIKKIIYGLILVFFGHKNEKIGNIFLIDKIVDNETQKKISFHIG